MLWSLVVSGKSARFFREVRISLYLGPLKICLYFSYYYMTTEGGCDTIDAYVLGWLRSCILSLWLTAGM